MRRLAEYDEDDDGEEDEEAEDEPCRADPRIR